MLQLREEKPRVNALTRTPCYIGCGAVASGVQVLRGELSGFVPGRTGRVRHQPIDR